MMKYMYTIEYQLLIVHIIIIYMSSWMDVGIASCIIYDSH